MTTPEEALEAARRAAQEGHAQGAYAEAPPSLDASPVSHISNSRLVEWSLLEPDIERVISTRRAGAPITAAKRGVLRAIRQYLGDLIGQQSRYNAQATAHIINLEDRVSDLEEQLQALRRPR